MNTSVTLRLKLASSRARSSLVSVLAPDNRELPKGLELSVQAGGREVDFKVGSSSPSSSLSTVLALLRDVALFQEVWLLSHGKDTNDHRV